LQLEPSTWSDATFDLEETLDLSSRAPATRVVLPESLVGCELVGRYRLLRHVGSGGTGAVFQAWDQVEGVERAVKTLRPKAARSERPRRRLAAEAVVMTLLQHPHVLPVYDMGVTEAGVHFMVMQWAHGSLREHLHGPDRLAPEPLIEVVLDVLDALQVAHDRGIVHRDVKPANVLLDARGRGLLADFGIALLPDADLEEPGPGQILGSPRYMAPEQRRDPSQVTPQTDLYGVGTTLFQALTEVLPPDLSAIKPDHPYWDRVPRTLRPVLARATHADPESRYPSAQAMADALRAARDRLAESDPWCSQGS